MAPSRNAEQDWRDSESGVIPLTDVDPGGVERT